MTIVHHADALAFLAASAPVRARSEASDAFVRAWVRGRAQDPPLPGTRNYCATFESRESSGLALQHNDGPLVLENSDPEAAAAFARELAREQPGLDGVVGSLAACEAFAREWRALTGRSHRLRLHLRHHVLSAVAPVPAAAGAARPATPADIEWLVAAHIAFAAEAGIPFRSEHAGAFVANRVAQGRFRIWEDSGRVACVGHAEAGDGDARIGPVYTLPAMRRRGYATALVANAARELLNQGRQRIFLVTDQANPTSNAIYARIGFRPLDEFRHFDFVTAG